MIRHLISTVIVWVTVFGPAWAGPIGRYTTPVPGLLGAYSLGQVKGPTNIDFGSQMASVTGITVHVSGNATNNSIYPVYINILMSKSNIDDRLTGESTFLGNGQFARDIFVTPFDTTNWTGVLDGITDISLTFGFVIVGISPLVGDSVLNVTNIVVNCFATPVLTIRTMGSDGQLVWSRTPAIGTTVVQRLQSSGNVWTDVASFANSSTGCVLQLTNEAPMGIYRCNWR